MHEVRPAELLLGTEGEKKECGYSIICGTDGEKEIGKFRLLL
jgi:hypothetical protein